MRWMWIDKIITYEPDRRLVAVKAVSLAEEHLHDHLAAFPGAPRAMPASLIIEGMAQTAGVLVGTMSRFREKVILAKITRARVDHDVLPGQMLRYDATLERYDGAGAATHGIVRCRDGAADEPTWHTIGTIDLLFSHADHNMAGIAFPAENFVFSGSFRALLRESGLFDEMLADLPPPPFDADPGAPAPAHSKGAPHATPQPR